MLVSSKVHPRDEKIACEFRRIWRTLPFDEWDCAPGEEWIRALTRFHQGVSLLMLQKTPECACSEALDDGIWRKDFSAIMARYRVRLAHSPDAMMAIAELFRSSSFRRLSRSDDIQQDHARLFLRIGAELGNRQALLHLLTVLGASEKSTSQRYELVAHLLHVAQEEQSPHSRVDTTNSGTGHVVFHGIAPGIEGEGVKEAARFQKLVLHALPLVGRQDARSLAEGLRTKAPWLGHAIDVLQRRVDATLLGWTGITLPPLLFVGPPGAGKSWLARQVGELLDIPTFVVAAAGARDNVAIKGVARGWATARPGQVLSFMAEHGVANPLVIVDEIDKADISAQRSSLLDTLHQLLEPENARQWVDEFLLGRCDLSRVSWIATANSTSHLPRSLLSRFQIIQIPVPEPKHRATMLHSVMRELEQRYDPGFEISHWLGKAEWAYLERYARTPRFARRLLFEMIGLKIGALKNRPH